jgi:hypothetical protein
MKISEKIRKLATEIDFKPVETPVNQRVIGSSWLVSAAGNARSAATIADITIRDNGNPNLGQPSCGRLGKPNYPNRPAAQRGGAAAHRRHAKAGERRNLAGAFALFVELKNPLTHRHRDGSHNPSCHLSASKSCYIIDGNSISL